MWRRIGRIGQRVVVQRRRTGDVDIGRRYERIRKGEVPLPDVLFVDGGKGQLAEAMRVLEDVELDWLTVVAVAKGRARRAGAERPPGTTIRP